MRIEAIFKYSAVGIIFFSITSCAVDAKLVNADAGMMPNELAREHLVHYFGTDWVDNPYLTPRTNPILFCGVGNSNIKYEDIVLVVATPSGYGFGSKITLKLMDSLQGEVTHQYDCKYETRSYAITVESESDVRVIVNSLIALGARVKGYVRYYH